jgi:hypothetical protein
VNRSSAYLYSNGNAVYFGPDGEQLGELQRLGLCGLHEFVRRYPEAPVHWGIWNGQHQEVTREVLPWLLRCLRRRPGKRPTVT